MSNRYYRIGSIYGSRWYNNKVTRRYGLPTEERLTFKQWPIVSGDMVQVTEGPDKGKVGQVLFVKRKTNQLVVKDVNLHVRTKKASPVRGGFFYKTESPIHYTNVQLIDPINNTPTKVKFGQDAVGNSIRYSAQTGAVIPKQRIAYKKADKSKKVNKVLDTKPEDVWAVTFKPIQKGFNPTWEKDYKSPKHDMIAQAQAKLEQFKKAQVIRPTAHV